MNPTVSIIIATYNRAHYIPQTLKAIADQSFYDWECLIIDDGGDDNTAEVIRPFLVDSRFSFHKRDNKYGKGLPGSRNYGLDLAKGDYIIFYDDDDIPHPENLTLTIKVASEHKVDFVHYRKLSFETVVPQMDATPLEIEGTISIKDIPDVVLQKIGLASCTVLWKKSCFENIRFVETLAYAEEWECYLRIIASGYHGIMINNTLYYNRKHQGSNTHGYFHGDPFRRKSKSDAVLLVFKNLMEKGLISDYLIRYFVFLAYGLKEYNTAGKLLNEISNASWVRGLKWKVFYIALPLLLTFSKMVKKIKK